MKDNRVVHYLTAFTIYVLVWKIISFEVSVLLLLSMIAVDIHWLGKSQKK